MDYLISFLETYGYAAMFIAMVLENANIPIPSEIVLGFSGYLIAQGVFEMNMTMIVATAAGVVGSILSYWMGEHGGRPLLKKYGGSAKIISTLSGSIFSSSRKLSPR